MNRPDLSSLLGRFRRAPKPPAYPVALPASRSPSRGTVLFSYMTECLSYREDDPRLTGHSHQWECRAVAHIFNDLGFDVEAIHWDDWAFRPGKEYKVIFDISSNLPRLAAHLEGRPLLLLHRTGADAFFQNAAEMRRVRAMEVRRGITYCPKRTVAFPDLERLALEQADAVTLFGNEWTRQTYPATLRDKLQLVPVSGSDVRGAAKRGPYVAPERHFLCFCGDGAVHKGVDLLLEVFGRHPELTLHIVGHAGQEPDFRRAYLRELTSAPNIHYHGFLRVIDPRFKAILDTCFAFVLPTCSESMSAAVVTCMQLGLYPIISHESGVTLPGDCGRYLETCSVEEIETAVGNAHERPTEDLEKAIAAVQAYAAKAFSREAFRDAMTQAIGNALKSL